MTKTISRENLKSLMDSKAPFKLVDVLKKDHYQKEHIKGAISMPLNELEKRAKKMFKKDDKIVVYCASFDCQASTKAAEKLMRMGFKDVLDYKGGLKDYKESGLPVEGCLYEKTCVSC